MSLVRKTPPEFREYSKRALIWAVIDLQEIDGNEWFQSREEAEAFAAACEEGPRAVIEVKSHYAAPARPIGEVCDCGATDDGNPGGTPHAPECASWEGRS